MKALLALNLVTLSFSVLANTISFMDECTLALRNKKPWKSHYVLNGSRVTGQTAQTYSKLFVKSGAEIETIKDIMGVARYDVITLTTTLESEGLSADSCEGISYAKRVDVCTIDQTVKVCETFCRLEWRGLDCR